MSMHVIIYKSRKSFPELVYYSKIMRVNFHGSIADTMVKAIARIIYTPIYAWRLSYTVSICTENPAYTVTCIE